MFYKLLWDHADKSLIPTIFHPDFTFRGSLGPTLVGYQGAQPVRAWRYSRSDRPDARSGNARWLTPCGPETILDLSSSQSLIF
jgi:hypothetical protein